MRKIETEKNGVVVYKVRVERPDGTQVECIPIPIEITANAGGVTANINGNTIWTPELNGVFGEDSFQNEGLTETVKGLVVTAMMDAMRPYLPENAEISEVNVNQAEER